MKVILLILVVTSVTSANLELLKNDSKYCYSTDKTRPQLAMFSNTSPYDGIRGEAYNPSSCTPSRFWLVSRHGSRYPSIADTDILLSPTDPMQTKIMNNFNSGKTALCKSDAENIKEWKLDPILIQTEGPANLSATGWNEIKSVAQRYQAIFSKLLPKSYSQPHYFFRNSPYLRTRQTAQAFAEGLFGNRGFQQVNYTGGSNPDFFMVPFYSCSAWTELFSGGISETQAFADGPKCQQMITEVSNKLGFSGSDGLNQTEVFALITHCQYEQILNHQKASPFCSAFSPANIQVYEYYKDLMFYYMLGYGSPFNNMGCFLLQDMINFLQAKDDQKAKLSFGHDATLCSLFVTMGLFKDSIPLTPNNFEKQISRQWKTTRITPMGANLAVIRYECKSGEDEVLFELNEKPLLMPGCSSNGMCKMSTVLNLFGNFANVNCASLYCDNN